MTDSVKIPAAICYLEIPAPDIERATSFYGSIFGWTIEKSDLTEQPYHVFRTGEGRLSGGFDPSISVHDGGVLFYIEVDDMEKTLEAITYAGGTVIREKSPIGAEFGYFSLFRDPNGNRMGLWSPK